MVPPPCSLVKYRKHMCQTFVAKLSINPKDIINLGQALVIEGNYPSSYAWVHVEFSEDAGHYLVLTTSMPRDFDSFAEKLKRALQKQAPGIVIDWVSVLSVRLQRLFGWGDVTASADDVRAACEQDDFCEVLALMPGAALLPDRDDMSMFPSVFEALRAGLPASVEDCAHNFSEHGPGPCANDATHQRPFHKCGSCDRQLCLKCVRTHSETDDAEKQRDLRRALHDIQGTHVWILPKNGCNECSVCDAIPALVCECGAQRCLKHLAPRVPLELPGFEWKQSLDHPEPFFVVDNMKIKADDKLAFMRQELGYGADLVTFATKFLDLFGSKIRGSATQKVAVLNIWSLYEPEAGKLSCAKDLPAKERTAFLRVWDPDAPEYCQECPKACGVKKLCSDKCAAAGHTYTCRTCDAVLDTYHPYCSTCKRGGPPLPINAKSSESYKEVAKTFAMMQRVWWSDHKIDPAHEPARKRHRRL